MFLGSRVSVTPRALLNRGRKYGPSVLDRIRIAASVAQVEALLGTGSPSVGTRGKWERAAAVRIAVLRGA